MVSDYGRFEWATSYRELKFVEEKSFLGLKKQNGFKWIGDFNSIPKQYFPETWGDKYGNDPLVIINLLVKNGQIHLHTKGGNVTGLKSGPYYEFSKVGVFDYKMNLTKVFDIEEGLGCYSDDKKFFIVHKHKGKNRLLFYDTENYELVDELSLTKKQNLGEQKNLSISTELVGDNLRVYNAKFMNDCMIKTTHNNV